MPERPADPAIQDAVAAAQAYYDGAADTIYRDIWGENLHLGLFERPDQDLPTAMERSNRTMADLARIQPDDAVLEVGCGYGGLARFLARTHGCSVLATNVSERELDHGRALTGLAGLDDKVRFAYGDFHKLDMDDDRFDVYWSQEAFLHAVDKRAVLAEAKRVLKPGGRLVFTDVLLRADAPDKAKARVLGRVGSRKMGDTGEYRRLLANLGFTVTVHQDWSANVALTYGWVRDQLVARREEFTAKVGADTVAKTLDGLDRWVEGGTAGHIGWELFVATA